MTNERWFKVYPASITRRGVEKSGYVAIGFQRQPDRELPLEVFESDLRATERGAARLGEAWMNTAR